jgi:hypothetical protein
LPLRLSVPVQNFYSMFKGLTTLWEPFRRRFWWNAINPCLFEPWKGKEFILTIQLSQYPCCITSDILS